ncbi:MAG: DUF262 domain-containing protein [Bacillota bacterium]
MGLTQLTVHEVVKKAVSGYFQLPAFQRPFVWSPDQVKELAVSLYSGYPIGTLLLWEPSDWAFPKGPSSAFPAHWIVDGQQRTTALCLLFGQRPNWWDDRDEPWDGLLRRNEVMAAINPVSRELDFALANPVRRRDPNWIPVRRILARETEESLQELVDDLVARPGSPQAARPGSLYAALHALWHRIRTQSIPVITVNHDVEDVVEIFTRLNRQGTQVREADVIVAVLGAAEPGWVRSELLVFLRELADRGFDLGPGILTRALIGMERGTARLMDGVRSGGQLPARGKEGTVEPFWGPPAVGVWPRFKEAVALTLRHLNDRGLLNAELLPSKNSLIPLFAFVGRFLAGSASGALDRRVFGRAFRWFLMANREGRYSGSAVTALSQDLARITRADNAQQALHALEETLEPWTPDPDDFLVDYRKDRFMRLLLYLTLFQRGAVDWVNGVRIGFERPGSLVSEGFEPDWHHIFPASFLRRSGIPEESINALANVTVLNERTNRYRLSRWPPSVYVRHFNIPNEHLESHLVDPGIVETGTRERVSVEAYEAFIRNRAERLAQAARQYLDSLARG